MTTTERIRTILTNHTMPSQSNEMLGYEVYNDNAPHEGEPLFQEETGKYDLDTVSVFVAKLYQLLDCDDYKEYLTWNETGDVFVICNMDEFAQNVLPKYFKHCKFTSFVRQLNIYGFYRVSDARKSKHVRSKHACVFSHSQFRRGRQDLLPNIRRKVSKTVRRKPRNTDSTLSQNHVADGSSTSQSIYSHQSSMNTKSSGNMNKDLNLQNSSLNIYPESKDFLISDNDTVMRKRIADLTTTTENLRKDLKQISSIVNDRLLPEVRNLAEGLHKHQDQLIALTHLVTCAFPEGVQSLGVQLLQDVTRGYSRHMPYEIPKRMRLDDKPTVKTEQTSMSSSVPTVPSSRVPTSYSLFTSNSNNNNPSNNNNLMNGNNSPPTEPSVTPSALTIPSDSQSAFTGSSIMGEFQQSPHNTQPNLGFNDESWSNTMISDPVNTVPSSNISYNIFPTTTTTQSPVLYSPSPNQQQSPPLSHHSVPSRSSSIALSPAEFVENSTNSNSNDILTNAPVVTSPTLNTSGTNSPVHQGDVVVASSPTSNSSSPITSTAPSNLSNYYHHSNPILQHMEIYHHQSFSNF